MPQPLKLAIVGAGLIGRRHLGLIKSEKSAVVSGIVDPAPEARALAEQSGTPWFADMEAMFSADRPDGIIIATPNQLHRRHALAAIASGIPCLVEKPIADTVESATEIVSAAREAGVPLLVGHHRRHNPLVQRAKAAIDAGQLGRLVAVHGFFWLHKPAGYFDVDWRTKPGAGPILINLIHDIDLLRYLCGDIAAVHAMQSSDVRGLAVEDTAVAMFRFAGGALGTITVSDTIAAPWSWELTAAENPDFPPTDQHCYMIGGTKGSLSVPNGELWQYDGAPDWWTPIAAQRQHAPPADPLALQIAHFCRVIGSQETPLVTGEDGLAALRVIDAMKRSAATGTEQRLD